MLKITVIRVTSPSEEKKNVIYTKDIRRIQIMYELKTKETLLRTEETHTKK